MRPNVPHPTTSVQYAQLLGTLFDVMRATRGTTQEMAINVLVKIAKLEPRFVDVGVYECAIGAGTSLDMGDDRMLKRELQLARGLIEGDEVASLQAIVALGRDALEAQQ